MFQEKYKIEFPDVDFMAKALTVSSAAVALTI